MTFEGEESDYETDGITYVKNKELKKWLKLRLLENNCNNCCYNIKKIFSFEPKSPPRYISIYRSKI